MFASRALRCGFGGGVRSGKQSGFSQFFPLSGAAGTFGVEPDFFAPTSETGLSGATGLTTTVFGATSPLGKCIVQVLGSEGTRVVCPHRSDEYFYKSCYPMGDLGQIVAFHPFNVRYDDSLIRPVQKSHVAINCIGLMENTRNWTLEETNVNVARRIARFARQSPTIQRFIHISCLGADPKSNCEFLRTKGLGEIAVREEFPSALIIRPGYPLIGGVDTFYMRWAQWFKEGGMGRIVPILPIPNQGKTILYPTPYGDAARAIVKLLHDASTDGRVAELAGFPHSVNEMMDAFFVMFQRQRDRRVYLPQRYCEMFARVVKFLTYRPHMYSPDAVRLFATEQKLTDDAITFKDLDIDPAPVKEVYYENLALFRAEAMWANRPNLDPIEKAKFLRQYPDPNLVNGHIQSGHLMGL
eukprot:gnl/Spiro4/3266_TR1591_c0_g1_i1.p1 gnl/Spiro4/3266_TR1591_c0_g1~~gnl/Spiro4/3266_TR1591_c0_g1_i1.p1  ORF type:complete len:412 (+),score=70.45 gnl/Spiro4/3266_TR1591_c0_g1_i1:87-1322(+)